MHCYLSVILLNLRNLSIYCLYVQEIDIMFVTYEIGFHRNVTFVKSTVLLQLVDCLTGLPEIVLLVL